MENFINSTEIFDIILRTLLAFFVPSGIFGWLYGIYQAKTNKQLRGKLSEQEEISEVLNKEIKYLTKVNKTFSDGLDALKKKQGGL